MNIDRIALKAKTSEKHLSRLLLKLDNKLRMMSYSLPEYVKLLHDQDGCLKSLVWDLVRKYDINCGSFMAYLTTSVNFLIKSEHRKTKKFNTVGKCIVKENNDLYKKPYYEMVELLAERESFYLACNELVDNLSYIGRTIFNERINPSKRTISISIYDSFEKGGSDCPVRLTWKHIAKSLKIPYTRVIKIVNEEVMMKANVIFRKYGFFHPFEYRDNAQDSDS